MDGLYPLAWQQEHSLIHFLYFGNAEIYTSPSLLYFITIYPILLKFHATLLKDLLVYLDMDNCVFRRAIF